MTQNSTFSSSEPAGEGRPLTCQSDDWIGRWAQTLWQSDWATFLDVRRFVGEALRELRAVCAAEGVALLVCPTGQWQIEVAAGQGYMPPVDWLGKACSDDRPQRTGGWWIVPVRWSCTAALVIWHGKLSAHSDWSAELQRLWNSMLALVHQVAAAHKRCHQLETILDIVADWQATLETEVLLERIAEAATRMLHSERASIFLWDRSRRTLVARPALGVEGGELRIPDDRGVVGKVVHSGQPQRVNIGEDQSQIDRSVDQKLGFRTESLLCVPLLGSDKKVLGAFEMINKREGIFTDEDQRTLTELARHAAIALENTRHFEQLLQSRNEWANQATQHVTLLGQHPAIDALRQTIQRVADTDLVVLLLGENGTGKEVVCRMIHALSHRRHEPLVAVNCAAMPETLLESELFGHEQGAFTDARESRPGKFEVAGHGTLFLDEIGELSSAGQAKLLRAIEERAVVRVGGTRPITIHARIVAATNRDLLALVREHRFREDLYYRLNVVTLRLPPLRDRGEDVLLLADHFLSDFCTKAGRKPLRLTSRARQRLLEHPWPGNVRELRNLMERFAYLHPRDTIDAADLEPLLAPSPAAQRAAEGSLQDATRKFQIQLIEDQLRQAQGSVSKAARALGMHRANLYRKMRQLGMPLPESIE